MLQKPTKPIAIFIALNRDSNSSVSMSDGVGRSVPKGELGKKSVRSGAVNLLSQLISIGLQFVSTVTLARLLSPEDYGLVGMVLVVITFASLFKDFGLSSATVQRESLTSAQVSVLFWVNIAVGAFLTAAVAVSSPFVAWFFDKPELKWMTVALAGNIFLSCLGAQHTALLVRKMRFKELAIARISGAFGGLVVSIVAALANFAQWSLISGAITVSLLQTAIIWYFNPWRPTFPRRHTGARSIIRYGMTLTGFEFVNFLGRNLDNILIGKVLGDAVLGMYTRMYSIMMQPISNVRVPLMSVAVPVLSQLQNEEVLFYEYYKRLIKLLSAVTIPMAVYGVVFPRNVIEILLGERWMDGSSTLRWLSVAALVQPISGTLGAVLVAKGLANRHLHCGIINAVSKIVVFVFFVGMGIEVMSLAYAASVVLMFPLVFVIATQHLNIKLLDFVGWAFMPFFAASVSAGCTSIVLGILQVQPVVEIILSLVLYSSTYVLVVQRDELLKDSIRKVIERL